MDRLLEIALTNALTATLLAVALVLVERWMGERLHPALVRGLWVVVLLRLLCPPLFDLGLPLLPSLPETAVVAVAAPAPIILPVGAAVAPLLTWQNAVVGAWLAGSLFFLGLVTVRTARFRRLVQGGEAADADLRRRLHRLADRLGITRPPSVTLVAATLSPVLWAAFGRRRLVLPRALFERLSELEQDALLVHELAHLRRRDGWVRWLELLTMLLYWWHPVAWWARRRLCVAEEACCDALVTRTLPGHRRAYADCLLKTLQSLPRRSPWRGVPVSGLGDFNNLKGRLTMILTRKISPYPSNLSRAALLAVACAVLVVFPTLARQGGESDTETLNLSLKEAPLGQVLESFQKITGLQILTQPDVDLSSPVTVEFSKVPRDEALGKVLRAQGLDSTASGTVLWVFGADGRHSPARAFKGEPVDLSLKDADLGDVLQGMGEITGLRFLLDAGVQGLVTVELKQVPWDQAVDAVLRLQGLTYTTEGNEVRVSRAQG
jgi:beta-lactamase regulating signal transducer with metallopeptidase domain